PDAATARAYAGGGINRRIVLHDAVGECNQPVIRRGEVEDGNAGAITLSRAAACKSDVCESQIGIAAGARIELHAAAIAVVAVGPVVYAILNNHVRNAGRGVGKDGDILIDRHHHVDRKAAGESPPGDNGRGVAAAVYGSDDIYRVIDV